MSDFELWRPIAGFPGYEASNWGRIARHGRWIRCNKGRRWLPYKIVDCSDATNGYRQLMLKRKTMLVHRLVALAWVDGYAEGLVVNHKNGDKTDNRITNLEWVTHGQNIRHAYRELGRKNSCHGKFGAAHPVSKAYIATNIFTGEMRRYPSGTDAAKDGFHSSGISHCISGRYQSHKGFAWQLA